MKMKIILALTACLFAAGSIINVHMAQNDHNLDASLADISVMAQADSQSLDRIICKCTSFGRCKAKGSGSPCAQGEPGGNIQCSNYDGNC